MHINGKLMKQAMLFICIPFQIGDHSWKKEFAPRWSKFFPLRAVDYGMHKKYLSIRLSPFNHVNKYNFHCVRVWWAYVENNESFIKRPW